MEANAPATIYISAASDLRTERDTLARTIAELPVTVAWRIQQTPGEGEHVELDALREAGACILVMGSDIRAPVGLEHDMARRAGRPVYAFLKRGVIHTPAGREFARQSDIEWRAFADARDLSRQVRRVLSEHLVRHAAHYALTSSEVERLQALLRDDVPNEESAEGRGADHSAVILSRDRFMPRDGTLIDES